MKSIIELLNENKKVSAWKLIETETESCELFYVLKNLETNRATKTKDINLTIYIDEDGTRGAASVVIYPHMNEEEIKKTDGVIYINVNFLAQKITLEAKDEDFENVLCKVVEICKNTEPDCNIIF